MDKLIFKIPRKPKVKNGSQIIRVSGTCYNVIEEISAKTGLSNAFVASKMIEFAAERTEFLFEAEDE